MWRKIRRMSPNTLRDLHTYLVAGINKRTSKGSRAQLLKCTPYIKLEKVEMVLETITPLPDLIDPPTKKGVLDSNETRTNKVVYDEKRRPSR